jgi:cell wall-associated NlpC family hydrolase
MSSFRAWGPRVVALVAGLLVTGAAAVAVPATAAAGPPQGRLMVVRQDTFAHTLRITGWAADPARPRAALRVAILVDGVFVRSVVADEPSPDADRKFGLLGAHGYAVTLTKLPWASTVTARSRGADAAGPLYTLATHAVTHYYPTPGERIVYVAKQYVGNRYVEGGASPSGFDCSGYTMFVYEQAAVRRLTHNAEAQRQATRRLTRAHARPGDLVFYMSGGGAYHVAVYAGHGWQYAAATVRDGVRYQPVWSSNVQYRTNWH